jgi:hypothetical protein
VSGLLDVALATEVSAWSIAGLVEDLLTLRDAAADGVLRPADLLRRSQLAGRVSSWAQAVDSAALADYVGPGFDPVTHGVDPQAEARRDRHLRLEVRVARGISDDAAGRDIHAARRMAAELGPVREAWSRGEVGLRHVHAFLDRTRNCTPGLTSAVLERLGDRAVTSSANRIGPLINAALAKIDPRGQAQRAVSARRHEVGVTFRSLPDGLGQITAIHKVEDARAILDRIDDDADDLLHHLADCPPCTADTAPELGPARAAAHLALVLREDTAPRSAATEAIDADSNLDPQPAGSTTTPPRKSKSRKGKRSRRGELQVVLDLATLLGLAENPGLLNGQPVPADIAREMAGQCGSMRRIVTDPVDGHLLDYGTRVYLPDKLRQFAVARDGTCQGPCCNQPAARSQLDHIDPFEPGPSNTANTAMRCKRDHDIKTAGDITILEHRADGTCRWRTRHGQTGLTPPRPCLPETGTAAEPQPDGRPVEPPPF